MGTKKSSKEDVPSDWISHYQYDAVLKQYLHVDNGGLQIALCIAKDSIPFIEFHESYCGHSEHILRFNNPTPDQCRKLSELFMKMANYLQDNKPE